MIRLSKSSIGEDEKKAVLKVLGEEYLGMGHYVNSFEQKLSEFFQRTTCCVNTGTSALHLALQAAGVGPGDHVLTPSLTYLATYQAITATGAWPVSCDIHPHHLCLSLEEVIRRYTKKTKAIITVHYSGGTGELRELLKFAQDKNIALIEDAAHAFGTVDKNQLIGSFGDITCFSFDGIKNITSGEGGCIVSHNPKIIKKCEDIRLLGVLNDTEKRYSGGRSWEFDVVDQGWRYHMSNIMAAIGIEQLKRFNSFKSIRQKLAKEYVQGLSSLNSISLLPLNYDDVVPHIFPIRVNQNRDSLREFLSQKNIQTGLHYKPNHLLTKFKSNEHLPHTEKAYQQLLTLPLHADLRIDDVHYICDQIHLFFK